MTIGEKVTALERWHAIPITFRVIGVYVIIILMTALGLLVRPENPVSRYWLREYGLQNDAIAFALILSTFGMLVAYYLWRNWLSIAIPLLPLWVVYGLLLEQIAKSSTEPILHAASAGSSMLLAIVCLYVARELDTEKKLNAKLILDLSQASPGAIGKTGG